MSASSSLSGVSIIERTRVPVTAGWSLGRSVSMLRGRLSAASPGWLTSALSSVLPETKTVEDFVMEHQCYTQWCWAAVAQSIGNLSKDSSNHTEQCKIANDQLMALHGDCCLQVCQVVGLPYDVSGHLSRALDYVKSRKEMLSTKPTLPAIKQHIRNGNPVCAHIQWKDPPAGRYHFVVIYGFGPDNYLYIKDPAYGDNSMASVKYDLFPDEYRDGASFEHMYYTKRD